MNRLQCSLSWLLALSVSLSAALGHAQEVATLPKALAPSPSSQEPPAPSGTPAPKVPSGVPVRAYGILWASVFATQPVQSFGLVTAVAPTSAANPALYRDSNDALLSFQVQQTRAGIAIGEGSPFKGTLEIDFVHFEQSSPVQQAYPRIRIGLLEWLVRPNHKLYIGQTWDIFGNANGPSLLSHSFNLVGTLFQSGNIGFMRQQLGWAGRMGNLELSLAAGMQGSNTGPSFNNLEQSFTPTGAARVMFYLPRAYGVIGVSGIGTAVRFTNAENDARRRAALGGHLFANVNLGALNVHAELYAAQNIANTGALNLGQGRYASDVADVGGYLSGKLTLGKHALTAMCGVAHVLRPSDVVAGYRYPSTTVSGLLGPATLDSALGPGIVRNLSGHIAYWYTPLKGLSLVVEPYVYATRHKLVPFDYAKYSANNTSWGVQLGSMYSF